MIFVVPNRGKTMLCKKWFCFALTEQGHNHCHLHTCASPGCQNTDECKVHKNQRCQHIDHLGRYGSQCRNIRIITDGLPYKFCHHHTCKVHNCTIRKDMIFGHDYCCIHKCSVFNCGNIKMKGSNHCTLHFKQKHQFIEMDDIKSIN